MDSTFRSNAPPHQRHGHIGHAHFWERAMSRDQFIKTAAVATGAAASAQLWLPSLAHAAAAPNAATTSVAKLGAAAPKPIPGGVNPGVPGGPSLIHVFPPGSPNDEPSAITDFGGVVGIAHVTGTGKDGTGASLVFDTDMRFMRGVYIGTDGHRHVATFGFV